MNARAPFSRRSFFPEGHFPQVSPAAVQQQFRELFGVWGRPAVVRVDNGSPWGSWKDLPPRLALWLIGLGIDVHWNTPCRPQENGVIERSQSLAQRWGEPQLCSSIEEFQRRIDREDMVQREIYPTAGGLPRMTTDPRLRHSGRVYTRRWESENWDWPRVREAMSHYAVVRQVDSSGKIGYWGGKLYVGGQHRGQKVSVQLDPDRLEWIVSDARGQQLRTVPANLTPEEVCDLTPKPRWSRNPTADKTPCRSSSTKLRVV